MRAYVTDADGMPVVLYTDTAAGIMDELRADIGAQLTVTRLLRTEVADLGDSGIREQPVTETVSGVLVNVRQICPQRIAVLMDVGTYHMREFCLIGHDHPVSAGTLYAAIRG